MMLSVHFLRQTEPLVLKPLHDALDPRIRLTAGLELPEPPDYHVLVAGRPKRQHLQASPRLHTLVIPWAGLPDETRALLLEFPGIAVHNLHHNAIPTAEMAIALLMSASKLIVPMDRALRANDWRPRYEPNPSLLLAARQS